ncbi:hypothetical protein HGO23_07935 [Xenorhabdus budapestensis]|uniref:Uncharacterized protein n=1 Tax=Xenorhabdus budapestensis TaxID=290110 RepID=A0ABX7VKW6_XENBU|nr:hypothetical protein [Xenorhabdus budapestensis]QTL41228.1 hypothetical protein HGO23_07935 [Xenorhabdus budapestensis]
MTTEELVSKLAIEFLRREKMQMHEDEFLEKYIELHAFFKIGLESKGMKSSSGFGTK